MIQDTLDIIVKMIEFQVDIDNPHVRLFEKSQKNDREAPDGRMCYDSQEFYVLVFSFLYFSSWNCFQYQVTISRKLVKVHSITFQIYAGMSK